MNKKKMIETRLIESLQAMQGDEVDLTLEDIARAVSTSRRVRVNPGSVYRARTILRHLLAMEVSNKFSGYEVIPGPRGGLEKARLVGDKDAIVTALRWLRRERRRLRRSRREGESGE